MFPTSYEKGKAIPKEDLGDHYTPMEEYELDEPEELPYKQPNLCTVESDTVGLNAYQELNTEDDDIVFKDEDVAYDKDITYDQVFELERKKRQLMLNAEKEEQQTKEKTEEKTVEKTEAKTEEKTQNIVATIPTTTPKTVILSPTSDDEDEVAVVLPPSKQQNVETEKPTPRTSSGCCF